MAQPISRRTWIASSVAGIVSSRIRRVAGDEPKQGLEIIDCHTHFYDPTRPEGIPWPAKGTSLYRTVLPKHLRELKQFRRVTGTVIVEASSNVEDNAWLIDLAKNDPFIVGIVGNLTPGTADFAQQVKRFATSPLFRGIRVQSKLIEELMAANSLHDFKVLVDHDLSLDVNGGPESPAVVAKLASKLGALRIVQNHIGNVRVTADAPPQEWQTNIRAAAEYPNVYCKISALVEGASRDGAKAPKDTQFYKPYIDVVWNAFGDDRVIYGSNWPVSELAEDYETLQRIVMEYAFEKGEVATAKFCSLNAKKAYKWVDRNGRH